MIKYKHLNETLADGIVSERMDKKTQHLFNKTVRNRQKEAFANVIALVEKHPQPLTLFGLLLIGYFKLFNRDFAKGKKIDWQADIAWLKSMISSKHLLSIVITEIIGSCYAFNVEFDNALKYYFRAFHYYTRVSSQLSDKIKLETVARCSSLQHMILSMEGSDYEHPAIDVADLEVPEQLRADYIPNRPLFHAYGDANFIKDYAQTYVQSVKSISPDYFVLLTIGNPDDESYAIMEKLQQDNKHIYFAIDMIPEQFSVNKQYLATYCACKRFLSAENILQALDQPYLLITDLDLQFNQEYQKRVTYCEDATIAYMCDKDHTFNPRSAICANQLFLRNNDIALQFMRQVSLFIRQKMAEENGFYWYLDQFALVRVFCQMNLAQNPECKNISDCELQHDHWVITEEILAMKIKRMEDFYNMGIKINQAKFQKYLTE
ncbi:MAG: hypothetical protein K0U39_02080 [Alphaproteobacteria bacterium]|nr:hypothetical protein [Alphaproteobacteria bacterium]